MESKRVQTRESVSERCVHGAKIMISLSVRRCIIFLYRDVAHNVDYIAGRIWEPPKLHSCALRMATYPITGGTRETRKRTALEHGQEKWLMRVNDYRGGHQPRLYELHIEHRYKTSMSNRQIHVQVVFGHFFGFGHNGSSL